MRLDLSGGGRVPFVFGSLHVAGPPCIDFSPMGARRREDGPSMMCLYIWARVLIESRPLVVIIENVPRFPVALLEMLF